MSCIVRNINDYPKLSETIRKRVGSNDKLYDAYVKAALSDEFIEYFKKDKGEDVDLNGNMAVVMPAIIRFYNYTHPDINNTATNKQNVTIGGFKSVAAREFAKRHVGSILNDLFAKSNIKLNNEKEYTLEDYIKRATKWVRDEFATRYNELAIQNKDNKKFKELYLKYKANNDKNGLAIAIMKEFGNIQDINLTALYLEITTNPRKFFSEVLLDSRLAPLKQIYKDELKEFQNADEELEISEEEDTFEQDSNDDADMYISNLNSKLGDFTTYTKHIDAPIRSYFDALKRVNSIQNGEYVYDKNNELGVTDTMDANECILALFTYGNFTSVDDMIASIRSIASNIDGFKSFAIFADELVKDRQFANKVYTNFGKTIITKLETRMENDKFSAKVSNENANKRVQLMFDYINSIKTSALENEAINESGIRSIINPLITSYKEKSKFLNNDTIRDKVLGDLAKLKLQIRDNLYEYLHRYYPTLSIGAVSNFLENNAFDGNIDYTVNANTLLNILTNTISGARATLIEYNSRQAEIEAANAYNRRLRENEEYVSPNKFKDVASLYARNYISDKSNQAAIELATLMQDFELVKTTLNSRNPHGNNSSDVINNSMFTNIINTLKNDVALKNFGIYRFQGRQYDLSNIMLEQWENGRRISYGLFTYEGDKLVPTNYAPQLLQIALYSGASDVYTNNNATYSEMSKNDYRASAFVNYFSAGNITVDNMQITAGNYFVRIPSDAPKTFVIKAPRYSAKGLFNFKDRNARNKYVNNEINKINSLQIPLDEDTFDYFGNDNTVNKKTVIEHLASKTIPNQYLSKNVKLNETNAKDGDEVTITYTYKNDKEEVIEYVLKGTYHLENNRRWLDNPEFIGILHDANGNVERLLPEDIRTELENIFESKGIREGKIERTINTEHIVFKQFKNIFKQELTNAAVAIDKLFVNDNGEIIKSDSNPTMPAFKDGYDNSTETTRKLYKTYHFTGKTILKKNDDGTVSLTGKVFTSDRFSIHKNGKEYNYLNELIGIGKAFDFLYGGSRNSLHTINNDGNISIELTDEQSQAVDEAISKFIIDYIEIAKSRISEFEDLLDDNLKTEDNYIDFALNHRLMYNGFGDLFEGDSKFYSNSQNFLKRAKEVQASGVPYALVDYNAPLNEERKIVDSSLNDSNIIVTYTDKSGQLITRPVKQYNRFRAITIKNTIRPSVMIDALTNQLIEIGVEEDKAKQIMEHYNDVTVNDAQSYITFEEWIRRISAKGELNKYRKLIDAINDENTPIDYETIQEFIQVQKNFYYDMKYDTELGIVVPRQIKNAEFVLVPRFIKGTELEQVYNAMMENNIDQLNTEETSKAAKNYVLTLWDNEGKITEENFNDFVANLNKAEDFNYNYLYKQQDTPQHMDAENKAGIQIMKKILDNIDSNSPLYSVKQDFFRNYVANIKESYKDLMSELNVELDENGHIKFDENGNIKGINIKVFYDRLKEEAERLGLNSNSIDFVTLKDDIASPIMPNYMSNISKKLENIAQSIVNARITRQKLPGFHAAQVTGVGFNFVAGKDAGGKTTVGTDRTLRYHPNGEPYIEVRIPKPKQLIGLSDEEALRAMQEGGIDTFVGYRIPTEGKQSIAVMKVVGFVDNSQGSTIIVPDDWVAQTGADFDIDSIYAVTYSFYLDKNNKVVKFKFNTERNKDAYFDYVYRNVDKKLRNGYKLTDEQIKKYKKDYKEYIDEINKETEDELEKQVKDLISSENEYYKEADNIIKNSLKSVDKKLKDSDIVLTFGDKIDLYISALETALSIVPDAKNGNEILNIYKNIADIIELQRNFNNAKFEQYKSTIGENIVEYIQANKEANVKKMAEISGLLSYEEFTKTPVEETNSRDARNNRILEDMLTILNDKSSLEETLTGSQFADIIAARDEIQSNTVKADRNARSPYDFFDQADYQEDVMSGAKLKAFSVTRDTFCSICNTVKPVINDVNSVSIIYYAKDGYSLDKLKDRFDKVYEITINGEKAFKVIHNTLGWTKDNKNVDSKILTAYSSQTTAHILDAVKEGAVPNVNGLTFAIYKTLVDIGSNYKTAVSFIMQPGITRIINAYNKNNSIYNKGGNYNPIHSAIKEIATELDLNVKISTNINEVIKLLNDTYKDKLIKLFGVTEKFDISLNIEDAAKLNIDSTKYTKRLKESMSKEDELLFDLGVILQYNKLSYFSKIIGDIARVTNPDKFGAKQSIYATNKVFDDINTLITDKDIKDVLTVNKDNNTVSILEGIYPDVNLGLDGYINSNNDNSSLYPSLNAFLKYASAVSVKLNRMLFTTEKTNFRESILGIDRILFGNMTEELYTDVKNYILSNIYNNTNIVKYKTIISDGQISFIDSTENEEKARIYGYNKNAEVNFTVEDINNPTTEELEAFADLSPAQKAYWMQLNFRDSGIFKYLKVNLFNQNEYRNNKSSKQTIEFIEDSVNIETALNEFDKTFNNNNPLVKLAAIDLIKYAAVVEGFKMRRKAINKVIKNNSLYNSIEENGTNFVNDADTLILSVQPTEMSELYNNYIRSHSGIKQIKSYRNKKDNKGRYEINTGAPYGVITFDMSYENDRDLAIRTGFVNSYSFKDNVITTNANSYIRLTTGRKTTLYRILNYNNKIYAYPLNLLEEYENSKWSANAMNNIYPDEDFFKSLISEAEKVKSNIQAISKQFEEEAKAHRYAKTNNISIENEVKPFDINNPNNSEVGGFKAVVDRVNSVFGNIDSPVSTWIRVAALTKYIPIGKSSIQYINGKPYIIKRVNLKQSANAYLKEGKTNRTIKELDPEKREIIEKARELGATSLTDVFNIMPKSITVEIQDTNEDDGIRNSAITEDPIITLGNESIRNMRRMASINDDRNARKIINNLREKGIEANKNDEIFKNKEEVIRVTANYVNEVVDTLLYNVEHFYTDSDGINHSINDSETIKYITNNPKERERFIKTILDASTFSSHYDVIKKLDINAQDDSIIPFLRKIQNALNTLDTNTIINNARERFFLEYLNTLSNNPLVQSDIITLLSGFNSIGFFDSYIADIQETSMPLIQVIMKEVMSNIRAREFKAKDRVKEFKAKITEIRKRASAAGKSINYGNIIDENGRFIQSFDDKLIEDMTALRDEINEAKINYGEGSIQHLKAKAKYDEWKIKHINQQLLDDYYRRKLDIEKVMIENYPTIFSEYKKLEAQRNEIYGHIVNGTLDEEYKTKLKEINDKMYYMALPYNADGTPKLSTAEGANILNSIEASNGIKNYVENIKKLREEYFDKNAKFGFDELLERNLKIIKSYEKRDSMGRLTTPINLLMENEEYRKAKEWLDNNAVFTIQEDLKKDLMEAFVALSEPSHVNNSVFKILTRKNDAYDSNGIIDGRKFSKEDVDRIREEQLKRYNITQSSAYSDTSLIKNAPTDDTVYSSEFYKGMTPNGISNPERLKLIQKINDILRKYYNVTTKTVETWNMTEDELKELGKLYDEFDDIKSTKGSTNIKEISKFIEENVEFVFDNDKYERARIIALNKGDKYYRAWINANTEYEKDSNGKETDVLIPRKRLYSYAKPKAAVESKYIKEEKTKAIRTINNNVQFVPTEYYYEMINSLKPGTKEFKEWYDANHIYNPFTHTIEPLKIWTKMQVVGRAEEGEWIPKYNQIERYPNPLMLNPDYKENLGNAQNYKKGTGYDRQFNANEFELEIRDYLQEVLLALAKTDKAKNYIEKGYLPSRSKRKEYNTKYFLKEFAKSFGFSSDNGLSQNWTDDIGYANDYEVEMPMLNQLRNKMTKDYLSIPKKLENETDEEYQNKVNEIKEKNKTIKEENDKIHRELLDNNWEDVFQDFIMQASHYNALQENKYLLFLGLEQLRNMKVYKTRLGRKTLLKDRKRSNENGIEYQTENTKYAQALYENSIRRILYNQFKSSNGWLTKTGNILQSISSAKYMMFNITGGLANVMYGSTQIFMERFAKEYFGHKDYETAKAMWIGSVPSFFANMYSDKSSTLADGIIKFMNIVDFDAQAQVISQANVDEYISRIRNLAFSPQTAGEHYMQNTAMLAMMNSHRIITDPVTGKISILSLSQYQRKLDEAALYSVIGDDTELKNRYEDYIKKIKDNPDETKDYATFRKDKVTDFINTNFNIEQKRKFVEVKSKLKKEDKTNFETNPKLIDQFELKDGNITFKANSILSKLNIDEAYKLLGNFKGEVISVNKKIHGVYDKLGGARIESEWWGGIVMQYHKHLYPGFMKRMRKKGYFNEERQTIEKGAYWSLFDFITTPISKFRNDLKENEYTALEGVQNLMKDIVDFSTHFTLNYKLLSDVEKANIRRCAGDLLGVLSALFLSIGIRLADDDDEGFLYNLCIYQADRLASESVAYTIPGAIAEAEKLWSNPIAASAGIEDLLKSAGVFVNILLQGDDYETEYSTGLYAGEDKIKVMLTRQIPIYRGINRMMKLDKNNKYFKLSDNILSVVPVQSIVDYIEK